MLLALMLLVLALVLWSLVQSGRLGVGRAVLSMAAGMLTAGAWLILACGAESVDVGYGFYAAGGPLPTLIVATRPQIVGAVLVWLASVLVAGVIGRHLTRRSARAVD